MTAREYLERYPTSGIDISEFVAEHGLDAELPPLNPDDIDSTPTMTNENYRSSPEPSDGDETDRIRNLKSATDLLYDSFAPGLLTCTSAKPNFSIECKFKTLEEAQKCYSALIDLLVLVRDSRGS